MTFYAKEQNMQQWVHSRLWTSIEKSEVCSNVYFPGCEPSWKKRSMQQCLLSRLWTSVEKKQSMQQCLLSWLWTFMKKAKYAAMPTFPVVNLRGKKQSIQQCLLSRLWTSIEKSKRMQQCLLSRLWTFLKKAKYAAMHPSLNGRIIKTDHYAISCFTNTKSTWYVSLPDPEV